jgi:hypothetical protein
MGKKWDQDLKRQTGEEWVRFDGIFLNPPLWEIQPERVPLTSYTTEDGMLVHFYERGHGSLKMQCHAGIPNAAAMQVLVALIRLAQCKGWDKDIYIHLVDVLEQLHMADSGQNREMVRDYIHMWRMVELEYRGYHDGIPWDYLLFRPLEEAVHFPIGRYKGLFKIRFGRAFQRMLSGAGCPDARFIKLDTEIYSRLKGRYALRLYEILMQNLTYRNPDADGIIRWPIGTDNLRAWMGVTGPTKEFKRNIKNAIEELRRIAGWNIILRSKGRRDAILQFATAKRLDAIERPSAVVPSQTLLEPPST